MRTLADRYSLEDCVLDGPRWSYWRGYDGVLQRSIGVLVLEPDHPLEQDVMAAARASAGAEDPRVLRVLDVLTDDEGTCFVLEWLKADSLEDLLAAGPLPEREAWSIVLEVARALAAVAPQGLNHGGLAPHWVLRGEDGRIRLLGLSIAGVLAGPASATTDAQGLGALLYAGLTARWPGAPEVCALPPAPRQSGNPVRPRMVLAGVPAELDDVAARALGLPGRGAPLLTPAAVVQALELAGQRVRGLADVPVAASDLPGLLGDVTAVTLDPASGRTTGSGPRRRRTLRAVAAVVVLALVAVPTYLGVRALRTEEHHDTRLPPPATASALPSPTASPTGASIPIVSIRDFDPRPQGNGSEDPAEVKLAIDGNPATAWHTVTYYKRPDLGGLKPGVGLLLDLGQVTEVGAVTVDLVGIGTSLELRSSTTLLPQGDDYTPIAKAVQAGTVVTLRPVAPTKARYLLVWLTSLPPFGNGYRGGIAEIAVYRN